MDSFEDLFFHLSRNFFSPLAPLLGASKKFSNLQENLLQMSCIPYPKLAFKYQFNFLLTIN